MCTLNSTCVIFQSGGIHTILRQSYFLSHFESDWPTTETFFLFITQRSRSKAAQSDTEGGSHRVEPLFTRIHRGCDAKRSIVAFAGDLRADHACVKVLSFPIP